MSEEIISPPFPVDTTTVPRMLQRFGELRSWLVDMRFWANETASAHGYDGEVIPSPEKIPAIPTLQAYNLVSIPDIFKGYMGMRQLREQWDAMVRVYEDNWDAKPAVVWRLQCVRMAYIILMEAFIDPETREARDEQAQRRYQKMTKRFLRKMGVPKELLGGDASIQMTPYGMAMGLTETHKDEIDFNALFHGEESTEESNDEEEDEGDAPGEATD